MESKMELLEDLFDLEQGELKVDMKLDDMDEWDSLAKLSLIALIDDEYGKVITTEDITHFKTVKDIIDSMVK